MKGNCHIHALLDGRDWRQAIDRHREKPDENYLHGLLSTYADLGYTYLRDGGDRWGVGAKARSLAKSYGITYRTPLAPLCSKGCYGGFIGLNYENLSQYRDLVVKNREMGADFIKIMISGLMDFDRFGVLMQKGPELGEIPELVRIAQEEGMAVMAHGNGADAVLAAARAGVDSIEHGAYLNEEALHAMKESGTVWVPTLSTIGNLRGKGRFQEAAVEAILQSAMENVRYFLKIGGKIAPGDDAGAWAVPHGCQTEETLLYQSGATEADLQAGLVAIMEKF